MSATIARSINADKIFDVSKERPRVVYYYGSFNPPHLGHLNAVEEAIKQTRADFAVVVADERANSWKPFRIAASLRTKMLEQLFKDKSRILVANSSNDHVRDMLLQSAHTIHLIGSDVFPRYYQDKIRSGTCPYPELVISVREGDSIDIPKESMIIHSFVQTNQGFSSTQVRKALYAHPEWYDSKNAGDQLPMLPRNLLSFILEQGIYSEKSQKKLEGIIREIKTHYPEEVAVCPIGSGLSKDLVFAVRHQSSIPIATVKVFQKASFKEDLNKTLKATSYLERISWKWIKTPEIKWSGLHEECGFLSQSYIESLDMGSLWKTLSAEEELKNQAFCIGRSLRELHQSTLKAVDSNLLEDHLAKLESKVERTQLKEFYRLMEHYRKNPGNSSCVHGDANPGNFFVGQDGVVTFIDLGEMAAEATGFPGYEYTQFIFSLSWFCNIHHTNPSIIDDCKARFREGYKGETNTPLPFSEEALAFYSFYWNTRN